MTRFVWVFIVCWLAGAASAATMPCPTPDPQPTTYDHYLTPGFSCTVRGFVFSDFGYSFDVIPATAVKVIPISSATEIGFEFDATWSATSNGSTTVAQTSTITYSVTAVLESLRLSFKGSKTGSGITDVSQNYSDGFGFLDTMDPLPAFDQTGFLFFPIDGALVTTIDVQAGDTGAAGNANITSVFNELLIPEPVTCLSVGVGLLAIVLIGTRIKR